MRKAVLLQLSTLSLALLFAAAPAMAGPWPRFRGPNGTGICTDQGVPVQWNDKDGILWKTPVPGTGNSSPVVWGERLFLQAASADSKERLLLCFSTADGSVRWQQSLPGGTAPRHPKNSLASSTPAVDGDRVYVVVWDGKELTAVAYDLDGHLQWSTKLGGFTGQHGAALSPIVFHGRVILANDQDGVSTLVALDTRTGKTAWQVTREPFRACYSTPFILDSEDGPQLIVASTAGITSYNPTTGKENWYWKWAFSGMALRTVGSPLYHEGLIFANSGDGSGARDTVAIPAVPSAGSNDRAPVWQRQRGMPYVPTMLASGDHLFVVNDDGIASCLVAGTGEPVWTERLGGKISASPIMIDGKIYAPNESGAVFVFPASAKFRLLAKNEIGEPILATPAVADGRLYIRGKDHLFCIGAGKRTASR